MNAYIDPINTLKKIFNEKTFRDLQLKKQELSSDMLLTELKQIDLYLSNGLPGLRIACSYQI